MAGCRFDFLTPKPAVIVAGWSWHLFTAGNTASRCRGCGAERLDMVGPVRRKSRWKPMSSRTLAVVGQETVI